ncbi:LAFE_0G05424g1_1 [Lachancea fermentati]|uniref:tRNA (uracil(54)-C(5))-methyltransferase n=1 Tax=Lachancea fermentati TaxID=4955 RepID=A0A1G4MHK0_LACFM|nr:LAFE_0G05424g1_1 [Lachancea fermentati]
MSIGVELLKNFKYIHNLASKISSNSLVRTRSILRKMATDTIVDIQKAELKRPSENVGVDKPQRRTKKIKLRKYKAKKVDATSPLGVLQSEIDALLGEHNLSREQITNDVIAILNDINTQTGPIASAYHREVSNIPILKITANGSGLALIDNPVEKSKKQVVVVPFGLPGDITTIKVFKTHPHYVESDLLEITEKSPMRKDELIKCRYFGKCSGCQFQSLSYEQQLELKKNTVINAYKFFAPELVRLGVVPEIGDTIESPLQFNYRTKLTPHFDMPKKLKQLEMRPPLGFGQNGRPTWRHTDAGGQGSILDIEECVIGTEIINKGMSNERKIFETNYTKYKKGATILLREHTKVLDPTQDVESQLDEGSKDPETGCISHLEVELDKKLVKTCVTNTRQVVTEYINGFTFQFSAGEFFQNNNSILPKVTKYVCDNLKIPGSQSDDPHYLVDAYCGSGLFSITASKGVDKVIGVEVSADSVSFAEKNAKANGIKNCKFIVGKAEKIFASIDTPCDRTSVILDPPRKGCDDVFLKQLSDYNPSRIVYISCNVHSQARDVQYFLQKTENGKAYKIESIRGFDFFPQTHHVESVCVLTRA